MLDLETKNWERDSVRIQIVLFSEYSIVAVFEGWNRGGGWPGVVGEKTKQCWWRPVVVSGCLQRELCLPLDAR